MHVFVIRSCTRSGGASCSATPSWRTMLIVREEVDAALAAWTGLPAQQASPPNPTGLAWAELAVVLPGRWLVLGAPRLGFACEAVSVSAVVDGSATGTYTDRGAAGTFKLTVAVLGHGST
jgi:hypothetical protein